MKNKTQINIKNSICIYFLTENEKRALRLMFASHGRISLYRKYVYFLMLLKLITY